MKHSDQRRLEEIDKELNTIRTVSYAVYPVGDKGRAIFEDLEDRLMDERQKYVQTPPAQTTPTVTAKEKELQELIDYLTKGKA